MPKYTAIQVAAFAGQAGFSSAVIPVVVTIAYQESRFDSDAIGDEKLADGKWGPSIGLMQVRSLRDPSKYSGADGMRIASKLSDPLYNMQVAKAIYDGQGGKFTDWSTYQNRNAAGSTWAADNQRVNAKLESSSLWQQVKAIATVQQSQFWNITPGESFWQVPGSGGQSAVDALDDTNTAIGSAATSTTSALDALGSLATKVQSGQFWTRVGIGAAGYALIFVGLIFLLASSTAVKDAAKTGGAAAVGLIPGGGAVTAVAKGAAKTAAKSASKGAAK